ncbi:hypothetical protein [Desulfovibrio intestinalis]|uniref:Uncharacterized protein n=1 Tax=Desulfovibrio intestinalis TaxID=58621 RepID=A0A7W8C299_9BACT|nr:hypothetical protein [Desulfovibrio intestinalis]MBB5144295.1 hypothetical protein [Desulfovibrio intestinalis]
MHRRPAVLQTVGGEACEAKVVISMAERPCGLSVFPLQAVWL